MRDKTHISLFHTDPKTKETKEIKFAFDKIEKVNIDISSTVCSFDTVRGKNKTDHAFKNQNVISMSGQFSERTIDQINTTFFKFGKNKLKNIQELFLSFLNDGRLFYLYTRVKTYKNYVLKACSFSYSNSVSSVKVDLTFVEILFRNNPSLYFDAMVEEQKPRIPYSPPLTDAVIERDIYSDQESLVVSFEEEDTKKELPISSAKGDLSLVSSYNSIIRKEKVIASF